MLSQQLLKDLLLFSTLKYSLRNHRELTRAVIEHVGMSIDLCCAEMDSTTKSLSVPEAGQRMARIL
jgi:hypothetical protein